MTDAAALLREGAKPTISFKVTAEEARQLRRKAREKKTTLSAYLRKSALPALAAARPHMLKRHPLSGLMVDTTPGPMVTMDEIKTSLADFPVSMDSGE